MLFLNEKWWEAQSTVQTVVELVTERKWFSNYKSDYSLHLQEPAARVIVNGRMMLCTTKRGCEMA